MKNQNVSASRLGAVLAAVLSICVWLAGAGAPALAQTFREGSTVSVVNSTSGTGSNLLAKITASGAITALAADAAVDGVCVAGCGTSSQSASASIARAGTASCVFDGPPTVGDYVTVSTTNAGMCHDVGATPPSGQIVGKVISATQVLLELQGAGASSFIAPSNAAALAVASAYSDAAQMFVAASAKICSNSSGQWNAGNCYTGGGTIAGALAPTTATYQACALGSYGGVEYVAAVPSTLGDIPGTALTPPLVNEWYATTLPTSQAVPLPQAECTFYTAQYEAQLKGANQSVYVPSGSWNLCAGMIKSPRWPGDAMANVYGVGSDQTTFFMEAGCANTNSFQIWNKPTPNLGGVSGQAGQHNDGGFSIWGTSTTETPNGTTLPRGIASGAYADQSGNTGATFYDIRTYQFDTPPFIAFGTDASVAGFYTGEGGGRFINLRGEGNGRGWSGNAQYYVTVSGGIPVLTPYGTTTADTDRYNNGGVTGYLLGSGSGGVPCATMGTMTNALQPLFAGENAVYHVVGAPTLAGWAGCPNPIATSGWTLGTVNGVANVLTITSSLNNYFHSENRDLTFISPKINGGIQIPIKAMAGSTATTIYAPMPLNFATNALYTTTGSVTSSTEVGSIQPLISFSMQDNQGTAADIDGLLLTAQGTAAAIDCVCPDGFLLNLWERNTTYGLRADYGPVIRNQHPAGLFIGTLLPQGGDMQGGDDDTNVFQVETTPYAAHISTNPYWNLSGTFALEGFDNAGLYLLKAVTATVGDNPGCAFGPDTMSNAGLQPHAFHWMWIGGAGGSPHGPTDVVGGQYGQGGTFPANCLGFPPTGEVIARKISLGGVHTVNAGSPYEVFGAATDAQALTGTLTGAYLLTPVADTDYTFEPVISQTGACGTAGTLQITVSYTDSRSGVAVANEIVPITFGGSVGSTVALATSAGNRASGHLSFRALSGVNVTWSATVTTATGCAFTIEPLLLGH